MTLGAPSAHAQAPVQTEVGALAFFLDHQTQALGTRAEQVAPLHAVHGRQARPRQHRGRQVQGLGQIVAHAGLAGRPGVAPNQRHAGDRWGMQPALEHQAPVTEQVAVVAGHEHHGALIEPELLQLGHHPADGRIDEGNAAVVQGNRLAHLLLARCKSGVTGPKVGRTFALAPQRPDGWGRIVQVG